MGADSTAAAYLMDRQKAFDPMGAFAAGVQLQSNLQKISLAGQAGQIDTILNVVKLQNEQADQRRKDALVKQQLSIASYNAETNRINATKPKTTTGTSGGDLGSVLGGMGFDPANGKFFLNTGQPQGPTEGQGDGPEVPSSGVPLNASASAAPQSGSNDLGSHIPGYDPFGMSAMTADQQVQRQQDQQSGGALPGVGGAMQSTDPSMVGPSMPGAPQRAPTQGNGRLYIKPPRITINSKGQPSMSFEVEGADPNAPPPLPTSQQLAALSAPYAHLGMQAVPDAENKRGYTFKEIPKMTGHDLSIATLPAEAQKGFYEDVNAMIKLGGNTDGPSEVEKMEAMGVKVERDKDGEPTEEGLKKAGQEMINRNLSWREGFNRAQAKNDNDLIAKAAQYANKLNAVMHGKQGWQTKTALDVINDIGLKPPASIVSNQLAAAPGGRTVSVANAGQGGDNVPMGTASVGSTKVAAQPAAGGDQNQVAALQTEIAGMPQGKERQQKQSFLDSLRKQSAAKPGAPAPVAASSNQDPWTMAPKAEPVKLEDTSKRDAATQNWEKGKVDVVRALKKTLTAKEIADLQQSEPPADPERGGGTTTYEKQSTWLAEHGKELGIKPRDGKPLRMDSPVFVDHEGRTIYMRDIMRETFNDARFKATRESASQSQSGNAFKVTVGKPVEVK